MSNALHTKSAYWIRQGIFDQLQSFDAFEARVNRIAEEKDRGDIFEIFVEGYLVTQTINQCVKHWVVGNIPLSLRERYKLPRDATGIDGIYQTHDRSHVAYQVKYRQKQQLTFAEVAPFLGITEQFSDRVIFTNAARLSHKALVRTRWVSADIFRDLPADALSSIEAWIKVVPIPVVRAKPDPSYQVQALADISETLGKHDKATTVMACGTGKTLVALWAAEQEAPKTVLVLVPSLTLLQQTLREWSEQTKWGSSFNYLCVCSDPTVGLKDDDLNIDKSEVGFRIDTDPIIVRQFLERQTSDIKVIFSTYHSSPVVGDGARGLPPFDFGIFDEAHRTTRTADSAFGYALSDGNIYIRKRLFLTATPRHTDIRHHDKEGEFRTYSMDDETVYGPRAHTLSFGAAAQKGIICRYKVVISLIDKEMVDDFTRKNGITLVEHEEISARWIANLIAVRQAIKKVDARKIISFHSRIRLADEFAKDEPRGIAYHLRDYEVRHVNGNQSSGERGEIIRAFADAKNALLTNARCLTEGINVPAVDMVAFIDPRQSRVDITQAVGRAMRKPRGPTTKTFGYIVVPVFAGMGEKDGLEEAIKSEKFDAVVDVLNALQEHDDELVDIIREIRERKGAGETFNPRRLNEKVEVVGPHVDLDRLTRSIEVEIAERIGSGWEEWFGLLTRFKSREGHCFVPALHVEGTFKLGTWVLWQRRHKDTMSAERRRRLDAIGFIWNTLENAWEEGFAALKKFEAREGHCRVPDRYIEGTYRLGQWVGVQRANEDTMPPERGQRLNAIGFVWDPYERAWEEGFAALKKFQAREGNCLVPALHVEGTFKLGRWVNKQRTNRDEISTERKKRLDAIGFVWILFENTWGEGFAALKKFQAREGNCLVPALHVEGTYKLGQWVSVQRANRDKMPAGRVQRLDAIGFIWDTLENAWEEGFAALKTFQAREGHCRVPRPHLEGTFKLGTWVGNQRANRNKMSAERKRRLDEIGFAWDPHEQAWEEGFAALTTFKVREGHCLVPALHVEGTFKLGTWVGKQRVDRDKMPSERAHRLDAIGFVWEPHERAWEEGFAVLKRFQAREGHCLVPHLHVEGTYRLGQWVNVQRNTRDSMPPERKQRLEAIGFVWDARALWEEGFAALKKFQAREGHCFVPTAHVEGTYKLGAWVRIQRANEDTVPAERKQRLNAIGFVWNPHESAWEEGFEALTTFNAREGHCLVAKSQVEGTFKLGAWVSRQRLLRQTMPAERRQLLDAIGFVWDSLESAWEEGFAALTTFKAREGHCLVPALHVEGKFKLGFWVHNQRANRDRMPAERKQRLDAIGFVWNTLESAWEDGLAALARYKSREGHCRVPVLYTEGTIKLGGWVHIQRASRDIMSPERRQLLDAIGFVWDSLESAWEEGFAALTTFKAREGHCLVPQRHIEGTFKLGAWVNALRMRRDRMPAERRRQLDAVGFVWDSLESAWEEGFAALTTFKAREGHCLVPKQHVEGTFKLGGWVSNQRTNREAMPTERRQLLDTIEFVWDSLESAWEDGFAALTTFKAREGHCLVPHLHVEGTFKLGKWVSRQRLRRDRMPAERRRQLDAVGFVWDSLESAWEEGFAALTTFKAREGHCLVPKQHVEGTFKLGGWVSKQRGNRDGMPTERKQRLDAIGFVWRAKSGPSPKYRSSDEFELA